MPTTMTVCIVFVVLLVVCLQNAVTLSITGDSSGGYHLSISENDLRATLAGTAVAFDNIYTMTPGDDVALTCSKDIPHSNWMTINIPMFEWLLIRNMAPAAIVDIYKIIFTPTFIFNVQFMITRHYEGRSGLLFPMTFFVDHIQVTVHVYFLFHINYPKFVATLILSSTSREMTDSNLF